MGFIYMKSPRGLFFVFLIILTVSACSTLDRQSRIETAQRIAAPSWMVKRLVPAGAFDVVAYERMHERFAPANVYIEGDGSLLSRTPDNPVALRLASRDKADNLVYLARPCQYRAPETSCLDTYWGGTEFSPAVIAGYDKALDEIKARYNIEGFNLIGHAGGGAIAALLAAERDDVLSLRTVAGTLDHEAFSAVNMNSAFVDSLNPASYGKELSTVPQAHFTGETDDHVPVSVYQSYAASLPNDHCVHHEIVPKTNHTKGWTDVWPDLLDKAPSCGFVQRDIVVPPPYVEPEPPVRTERLVPSKP